jgi:hypothetical protein
MTQTIETMNAKGQEILDLIDATARKHSKPPYRTQAELLTALSALGEWFLNGEPSNERADKATQLVCALLTDSPEFLQSFEDHKLRDQASYAKFVSLARSGKIAECETMEELQDLIDFIN